MGRTSRKGISLSFETIVVGTIVLVVLVVVIMFFSGAFSDINKDFGNLNSCEAKGGSCYGEKQGGQQCFPLVGCPKKDEPKENRWCCINEKS